MHPNVFKQINQWIVKTPLRDLSPLDALVNRDLVSGTVYYLMLVIFTLMPWLFTRC